MIGPFMARVWNVDKTGERREQRFHGLDERGVEDVFRRFTRANSYAVLVYREGDSVGMRREDWQKGKRGELYRFR